MFWSNSLFWRLTHKICIWLPQHTGFASAYLPNKNPITSETFSWGEFKSLTLFVALAMADLLFYLAEATKDCTLSDVDAENMANWTPKACTKQCHHQRLTTLKLKRNHLGRSVMLDPSHRSPCLLICQMMTCQIATNWQSTQTGVANTLDDDEATIPRAGSSTIELSTVHLTLKTEASLAHNIVLWMRKPNGTLSLSFTSVLLRTSIKPSPSGLWVRYFPSWNTPKEWQSVSSQ